jgi:urate oxidase
LTGEFARCYTHGDNNSIVPTDTMKNTVYALAKKHEFEAIESFGKILSSHFVHEFAHVSSAQVSIRETIWNRITLDGRPHDHAFLGGQTETRNCQVDTSREKVAVRGGLDGMNVLKTTRSGFTGYIKDQYTTLKETADRIFATVLEGSWNYRSDQVDWNRCYHSIRDALIRVFAEHDSLAVQQTLFAMGEAALQACADIDQIDLAMPNQHRLLANLQPFGMENANEIFVPTSEPFGYICGTIRRD